MSYTKLSKYYDKLLNGDVDYEKYRDFVIDICKENNIKFENYLDIACGTGNMTLKLSKYFRNTIGIDNSNEMLMVAMEKAIENRIKIDFLELDFIDFYFKDMDLITSTLDATNYILEKEDIYDYFKSIEKSLSDDGIFIFDINSVYKLCEILGDNNFFMVEDDVSYIWNNYIEDDICTMDITFFTKTENGLYEKFEEFHEERIYHEEEIEKIINSCNLKVIAKFDNYSNKKVVNKTERITYIIRKEVKNG